MTKNAEVREQYAVEVNNRFNALQAETSNSNANDFYSNIPNEAAAECREVHSKETQKKEDSCLVHEQDYPAERKIVKGVLKKEGRTCLWRNLENYHRQKQTLKQTYLQEQESFLQGKIDAINK